METLGCPLGTKLQVRLWFSYIESGGGEISSQQNRLQVSPRLCQQFREEMSNQGRCRLKVEGRTGDSAGQREGRRRGQAPGATTGLGPWEASSCEMDVPRLSELDPVTNQSPSLPDSLEPTFRPACRGRTVGFWSCDIESHGQCEKQCLVMIRPPLRWLQEVRATPDCCRGQGHALDTTTLELCEFLAQSQVP